MQDLAATCLLVSEVCATSRNRAINEEHYERMNSKSLVVTYSAFIIRTLVPVALLPILAYRLGSAGLGSVLAGQSLALLGCMLIEWGGNVTGPRDIALKDRHELAEVVSDIMGGRLAVAPLVIGTVGLAAWATPGLGNSWLNILACCSLAVLLGTTPLWFFQGRGRPGFAASIELASSIISLVVVLILVNDPSDIGAALLGMSSGPLLAYGVGVVLMYREAGVAQLSPIRVYRSLKQGVPVFIIIAANNVQGLLSTWLVAVLASPAEAAYFGVAYRIIRLVTASSFEPLMQVAIPRCLALAEQQAELWRLTVRLVVVHLSIACIGISGLQVVSEFGIRILFSSDMLPAAAMTRVLAWSLLPAALSGALTYYWLVPNRRDYRVAASVAVGGVAMLIVAAAAVPLWGGMAMVYARLVSLLVTAALVAVFTVQVGRDTVRTAPAE